MFNVWHLIQLLVNVNKKIKFQIHVVVIKIAQIVNQILVAMDFVCGMQQIHNVFHIIHVLKFYNKTIV